MKTRMFFVSAALLLAACGTQVDTETDATLPTDDAMADDGSMMADGGDMMVEDDDAMMDDGAMVADVSQSEITFVGESNIIDHDGSFETFDVSVTPAEGADDFEGAKILATIDLDSVQSDPGVEGHLKREDFFDVENYPTATYESTSVTHTGGSAYVVTGDMTVKGVTKEVSFRAEITKNGMSGTLDFPRQEFGVGNDSYGDKLLEPMVPVTIDIVFAS